MEKLHLDFETCSTVDLKKCGVHIYAADPSTQILCAAYAFGDEDPTVWYPGDPIPKRIVKHVEAGGEIHAFNAAFERWLWWRVFHRHGFPRPKLNQFYDTAADCAALVLPRSLDGAARALGLDIAKDTDGYRLMMQMCKPRSTKDGRITWWHEDAKLGPEKIARLGAYCAQDVNVERAVAKRIRPLSPSERETYLMDQRMNDRGMMVDIPLVRAAQKMVDEGLRRGNTEIYELTDGKVTGVTKVADMKRWMEAAGVTVENLKKDTVRDLLGDLDGLPDDVRRMLELRQELGKSSTAKLTAMLLVAGPDGRARGLFLFHGAGTGRWAGKLIQLQNFPRPVVKCAASCASKRKPKKGEKAKKCDCGGIERFIRPVLDGEFDLIEMDDAVLLVISSLLRSMLRAAPGNRLLAGDYAQIEARVVAWIAGQDDLCALFASGGKVYEEMAAFIYGKSVDEIGKDSFERQVGKNTVLGCFGVETLILTQRGAVQLGHLRSDDKVWDGCSWVQHGGVVSQGTREVIELWGVTATPDHTIQTGMQWKPSARLVQDARIRSLALATALVRSLCSAMPWVPGAASRAWWSNVIAGASHTWLRRAVEAFPINATPVQRKQEHAPARTGGDTPTSSQTTNTESGFSTASRQSTSDASTHGPSNTNTTEGGASESDGVTTRMVGGRFSNIWSRSQAGIHRLWNWIASIMIAVTHPATFDSRIGRPTLVTEDQSLSSNDGSLPLKPVFDVAHAGPRNRFTILTKRGPLLVHNCGFGMGPDTFVSQAKTQTGLDIPMEDAERAVSGYRQRFQKIKAFWKDIDDAAKRAIQNPGETFCCGRNNSIKFSVRGQFLWCRLPSGRLLAYAKPAIKERIVKPKPRVIVNEDGTTTIEERKPFRSFSMSYMGVHPKTKKWVRQWAYGGLLTENVVQAIARDLLVEAHKRHEAAGYMPVLTAHDEAVSEAPEGHGSLEAYLNLMRVLPAWAEGLPVEAEGWEGQRFRK